MAKEQKTIGLSREFIIHPGETLQEVLEDRNMSQKELAVRTKVTEKHISTVLNGLKPISVAFAKKLEYALNIEAEFWINLQANYDRELLEFEEANNISQEEISVLKNLKDILEGFYYCEGYLKKEDSQAAQVLDLRKMMNISDLTSIPCLNVNAAFRAQVKNSTVDPYVLFAWQRMCELITQDIEISDELDLEKLRQKLPEIKNAMFLETSKVQKRLEKIFSECGIAFKIVENYKGAPVQGFVEKTQEGKIIMCLTIRQSFADIFWFSLFHEIGHILNGDTKNRFVDFESASSTAEERADRFARTYLIPEDKYKRFLSSRNCCDYGSIERFASQCGVQPYIVLGRMMKDGHIGWSEYSSKRVRYVWR